MPFPFLTYKGLRRGDTPASPNKGDGCPFRPLNPYMHIICLFHYYVKEKRLPFATKYSTLSGFIVYSVLAKNLLSEDTRTATMCRIVVTSPNPCSRLRSLPLRYRLRVRQQRLPLFRAATSVFASRGVSAPRCRPRCPDAPSGIL